MTTKAIKKSLWLTAAIIPMALLVPAMAAFAQTGETRVEDEIVVTGSRIRRSNINTAIPVQGLDVAEIQSSGTVDLGEVLTEIPGVDFSLSPESTGLSTQNPGLSTISLRGLGGDRTLTLINGHRAISNSGNGERVSLQTIPTGFVRKVEVTTGGASAIYGADAISGVVNILLREDFDGIKAGYRYGKADRSGEQENTVNLTLGKNFNDERGNVMIGFTYDDETAVFADGTRPESIAAVDFEGGDDVFGINLSSNLPGGRFEGDDAWNIGGVWFNDQSLVPPDGRVPSVGFETDLDGFNLRPGRTLSPAVEVISGALKADYDLSSKVTAFGDIYFTRVNTTSVNAARSANSGTDIGPAGASIDIGSMSSSHPFIPPEVEETRRGSVSWRRRFNEVGNTFKENERDTLRSMVGLKGFLENDWAWDVHATYGTFNQEQTQFNSVNYQKIRNALRIESDGNGGYQCTDADARADGCVPLNIFGEGSITQEMADYIRYTGRVNQDRTQYTFAGNINGDVYELGAGPIKAALGFEYRKEKQDTIGDPDNVLEETSVSVIPNLSASFDVAEAYGELDIPLFSDSGVGDVSLQLAGRVGDYSTIGTIFSYNVGGSWSPTPDFRVRGQYSRSQRAPNITEFFSPPRGDFDDLDDPCAGLNADGTGLASAVVTTNCLSETGLRAFFANPDNTGLAFEGDDNIFGPNAGNNQLKEETADTFTIGAVFTPQALPGFSFIADYYRIDIDGAIGQVSTQDTADLCYQAADFPNNRFCNVITRDASTGDVVEIVNRDENLNNRLVEGIDVSINYDFEPLSLPGEFDVSFIYNHTFTNQTVFEGLNGPELNDFNGELENAKDQFRAKLGWGFNKVKLSYTWQYYSSSLDDITLSSGDADYFKFDSQSYHDIYARYDFENKHGTEIYAGIKNLANDLGPFVPSGFGEGSSRNIVTNVNRPIGREFYAGVRVNW